MPGSPDYPPEPRPDTEVGERRVLDETTAPSLPDPDDRATDAADTTKDPSAGSTSLPLDREIRDQLLAEALASGLSRKQARRRAGYGERTVRRRLAEPGFRRRLHEAQRCHIEDARNQLPGRLGEYFATLEELRTGATSESVRLKAARDLIDAVGQYELGSILDRLVELEERFERETRWEPERIDLAVPDQHDER